VASWFALVSLDLGWREVAPDCNVSSTLEDFSAEITQFKHSRRIVPTKAP